MYNFAKQTNINGRWHHLFISKWYKCHRKGQRSYLRDVTRKLNYKGKGKFRLKMWCWYLSAGGGGAAEGSVLPDLCKVGLNPAPWKTPERMTLLTPGGCLDVSICNFYQSLIAILFLSFSVFLPPPPLFCIFSSYSFISIPGSSSHFSLSLWFWICFLPPLGILLWPIFLLVFL